jgi:hypothetical protein
LLGVGVRLLPTIGVEDDTSRQLCLFDKLSPQANSKKMPHSQSM